jgi:hypothetical protein
VARRWGRTAREAGRTATSFASFALITYFGTKAIVKIEATQTRLFLICMVFVVAFSAAVLADHVLRDRVPTDSYPAKIWPRWHSQFSEPLVYRQPERVRYSYVVLPRPTQRVASDTYHSDVLALRALGLGTRGR